MQRPGSVSAVNLGKSPLFVDLLTRYPRIEYHLYKITLKDLPRSLLVGVELTLI